jgi:hypothetical protein
MLRAALLLPQAEDLLIQLDGLSKVLVIFRVLYDSLVAVDPPSLSVPSVDPTPLHGENVVQAVQRRLRVLLQKFLVCNRA